MVSLLVVLQVFGMWANSADYLVLTGTQAVLARGVDAILYNPANLAWERGFSLRIISLGVGVYNSSFSIGDYNYYSGGINLSGTDKSNIMRSIPGSGLYIGGHADVAGIEFSVGGFGFSVRGAGIAKATLPKVFLELMLYGNKFERMYSFSKPDEGAVAYIGYTLSYGLSFGNYSVGTGIRFLQGLYVADIPDASLHFLTTWPREGIIADGLVKYRTAEGGTGVAFDIGTSWKFSANSLVSICFSNINGGITWNNEPQGGWERFTVDSLTYETLEDTTVFQSDTSGIYDIDPFKTYLPMYFVLAVGWERGSWEYAMAYEQVINETPFYSRTPKFCLGLKHGSPGWFTQKLGIAIGGDEVFAASVGFFLNIKGVGFNFGLQQVGGVFEGAKGLKFGIDIGYRI